VLDENLLGVTLKNSETDFLLGDKSFLDLPLCQPTLKAIKGMGFEKMTHI
jgi:hypothetical protein